MAGRELKIAHWASPNVALQPLVDSSHVYGQHGSVVAKSFQPWYLRSSEVECFSNGDRTAKTLELTQLAAA